MLAAAVPDEGVAACRHLQSVYRAHVRQEALVRMLSRALATLGRMLPAQGCTMHDPVQRRGVWRASAVHGVDGVKQRHDVAVLRHRLEQRPSGLQRLEDLHDAEGSIEHADSAFGPGCYGDSAYAIRSCARKHREAPKKSSVQTGGKWCAPLGCPH